jgi:hypothetical protein
MTVEPTQLTGGVADLIQLSAHKNEIIILAPGVSLDLFDPKAVTKNQYVITVNIAHSVYRKPDFHYSVDTYLMHLCLQEYHNPGTWYMGTKAKKRRMQDMIDEFFPNVQYAPVESLIEVPNYADNTRVVGSGARAFYLAKWICQYNPTPIKRIYYYGFDFYQYSNRQHHAPGSVKHGWRYAACNRLPKRTDPIWDKYGPLLIRTHTRTPPAKLPRGTMLAKMTSQDTTGYTRQVGNLADHEILHPGVKAISMSCSIIFPTKADNPAIIAKLKERLK